MFKNMEEQITRIQHMEKRFDQAQEKVNALMKVMEDMEQFLPELNRLIDYYESGQWMKDYQDDRDGRIPENVKRGILSEDGIFNLLTDIAALKERVQEMP